MIQAARRTILLADSSKFRAPAFCTFCEVSQIDEIVTDDGIGAEQLSGLRALNVEVTVVRVERDAPEASVRSLDRARP